MSTRSTASPSARTAVFAQLSASGRVEQVVERLTDAIVLGVLAPGERLPSEAQLAKRFGVAVVTAREGLSVLRENGLVETRRGREGGSFVTAQEADHGAALRTRLRGISRVDLQDMALYLSVITAAAASQATRRALDTEIDALRQWPDSHSADALHSPGRAEGAFHLQLAVLSQSARLVREQIRLQAEFGPLLWYGTGVISAAREPALGGTTVQDQRATSGGTQPKCLDYRLRVIAALADRDGALAASTIETHFAEHLTQLLEAKAAVDKGEAHGH